jgi:hypothetical protein
MGIATMSPVGGGLSTILCKMPVTRNILLSSANCVFKHSIITNLSRAQFPGSVPEGAKPMFISEFNMTDADGGGT